MAIQLSDNIRVGQQKPLDSKYFKDLTPYSTVPEAIGLLPVALRHIGLTLNINKEEYWFKEGITDIDLILKTSGSSGGVGGTGATGQVTFWSDPTTLSGTNALFWDIANNRLGIGTSIPDNILHANGPVFNYTAETTYTAKFSNGSNKGVIIGFEDTTNTGFITGIVPGVGWTSLVLNPNGANVGIGALSPNHLLHINSLSQGGYIQMTTSETGSGINDGFHIGVGDGGFAQLINRENAPMLFLTNNIERLRIAANGYIGANTILPSELLHVDLGNILLSKVNVNSGHGKLIFKNLSATKIWMIQSGQASIGESGFGIRNDTDNTYPFWISDNSNIGVGGLIEPITTLQVQGSISINSNVNATSPRPAVNAGTLPFGEFRGYGTIDPSLDAGFLRLSAGGGTNPINKSYIDISGVSGVPDMTATIVFGTKGVEVARFDILGNFGIGLLPTEKLSINGYSLATGYKIPSGTASQFLTGDGGYSTLSNIVTGLGTANYVARWGITSSLTTGVIYDDGNNVGIAVVPAAANKLQVAGNVACSPAVNYDQAVTLAQLSGIGQGVSYNIEGAGWYRIAVIPISTGFSSGTINIVHQFSNNPTSGVSFSFIGGYLGGFQKLWQNGGYPDIFSQVRIVYPTVSDGDAYIEVFYTSGALNACYISLSNVINTALLGVVTAGDIPADYSILEITLTDGLVNNNAVFNGVVGLGTNSPLGQFHVKSDTTPIVIQNPFSGSLSAPKLRKIMWLDALGNESASISAPDSLNESFGVPFIFSTRNNANILDERMRIDADGNVIVGVGAASAKFHVVGSTRVEGGFYVGGPNYINAVPVNVYAQSSPDNGSAQVLAKLLNSRFSSADSGAGVETSLIFGWANHYGASITAYKPAGDFTGFKIYSEYGFNGRKLHSTFNPDGTLQVDGNIYAVGNVTAGSDVRIKTNIKPLTSSLEKVLQLQGVSYDRIDNDSKNQIGFIAQDLEKVYPEFVVTDNSEDKMKSVNYGAMVAVLTEAIKELKAEIELLKSR